MVSAHPLPSSRRRPGSAQASVGAQSLAWTDPRLRGDDEIADGAFVADSLEKGRSLLAIPIGENRGVGVTNSHHGFTGSRLAIRGPFLNENGVRVVGISNSDVRENLEGVFEMIYLALGQQPAPSPGAERGSFPISEDHGPRRPLPKGRGQSGAH